VLGETIIDLASNSKAVKKTGERARDFGLQHLTFSKTTKVFRQWLQNADHAPDLKGTSNRATVTESWSVDLNLFTQSLENQVAEKNRHIEELEKYIQHLERHISSISNETSNRSVFDHRPAMEPKPLKMSDHPLISIVIVTWNGIDYVDECVNSVLEDDYERIELIVVDNGSSDGTLEHVKARYGSGATIIENSRNLGFTRAVNQGISSSSGEVIFLLNQDAVIEKGVLKNLVRVLQEETIAIAGCKILHMDGRTLQHAGGILHDNGLTDHFGAGEIDKGQHDEDRDVVYVTGAAFAFKRALTDLTGGFDTRYSPAYFEELDFCYNASRMGYRIRYVHSALARHHESTSTGKFSLRFYYLYHRNRLRFILKHFSAGYFVTHFRRFEWNWLKENAPKEQYLPLTLAYLRNMHRIVWVFIRTIKNRIKR
jgi:GT2 family glycosyltransferase